MFLCIDLFKSSKSIYECLILTQKAAGFPNGCANLMPVHGAIREAKSPFSAFLPMEAGGFLSVTIELKQSSIRYSMIGRCLGLSRFPTFSKNITSLSSKFIG